MSHNEKIILVTGATGQQGGASAQHLQAKGWSVRALSRDPHKPAARALSDTGIEVVQGDLNDRASLDRALQGVYGVHSVQAYMPHDPTGEIYQGKNLAEAAKEAGVQHFIYSSVAGADQHVGAPEQDSKGEIEQHIRSLDLPATILRPTYLLDNFSNIPVLRQGILSGSFMFPAPPTTKLQFIACDDIGALVAIAFGDPKTFIGKTLELAGDEQTMAQTVEVFSRVIGRPVQYIELPIEQVYQFDANLAKVSEWIVNEGFHADVPTLRAIYPDLTALETYLRKSGWEQATL